MIPHAILQKGEKSTNIYLLVRYPNRFHIITVNGKLTEEAEERILSAPCSDSTLDEMGIKRLTLHRADLLGVGIGGGLAGDILVLHTRDKKLRYVFSDDCSEEEMTDLFDGIKRMQPPKNSKSSKLKKDWRTNQQDEKLRDTLKGVGLLVNAAAFLCLAGALLDGRNHPIWYTLGLLVAVVAVTLYLCFPLYFSLLGEKEYRRQRYRAPVTHLVFAAGASLFALLLRTFAVFHFGFRLFFLCGIGGAVLIFFLFYGFSREMRDNLLTLFCLSLYAGMLVFAAACHLNCFLNFDELPPQPYEVLEKASVGSCIVEINGEEADLDLPLALHDAVQIGDSVMVVHDRGFFGAEYAYVVEKAE